MADPPQVATIDGAWLYAAERDVEREEEERMRMLARHRRLAVKGKYELDMAAQLDADLKQQQCELRRKAALRRQQQDPWPRAGRAADACSNGVAAANARHVRSPQQNQAHVQQVDKQERTNVYARENERLAALLADRQMLRQHKRKKRPHIVEDMLAFQKHYDEHVRRVQRWWRAVQHRQSWRNFILHTRAAIQIQRILRGVLCRQLVRVWHANRTRRATHIQATVRSYLTRRVLQTWRQWEYVNAARIQAIVRGHAARRVVVLRRQQVAALHIQCLWRGHIARRAADKLWLSIKAVQLQRLVRGALARRRVRRRAKLFDDAATQLQRMFRGMRARAAVNELLRQRETTYREDWMRVLEVEEAWHRRERDRHQARLERSKLLERLCDLEEKYFSQQERINDLEAIYLDMQTQRLRVSPRAIEHGWVEEMESKMTAQRALITRSKMTAVFDIGLKLKQTEEAYRTLVVRIQALEEKRRQFEIWRDEEFMDMWERDCHFQHQQRQVQWQRRVAEQRRQWAIQFHHINGKRDKRWRGTCWIDQVREQAKQRGGVSLKNANLLAFIEDKWRRHLQMAMPQQDDPTTNIETNADRRHVLHEQVELVTTTAEMERSAAIFDPIFQAYEKQFAAGMHSEAQRLQDLHAHREQLQSEQQHRVDDNQQIPPATVIDNDKQSASRPVTQRHAITSGRVPWHLLDQLAGERAKLDKEKTVFQLWRVVPIALKPHKHQDT